MSQAKGIIEVGVDAVQATLVTQMESGIEMLVGQGINGDLFEGAAERVEHTGEQVAGERLGRHGPLCGSGL